MAEAEGSRKAKKAVAILADPVIPDKLYFRIGEVARLLGIAAYVLRFWEGEFPQLHPGKGGTGHRLYRRRDVEMALRIKRLLYNEGYTIPGARQLLKAEVRARHPDQPLAIAAAASPVPQKLRNMHTELKEIATLLARPLPGTRRLALVGNSTPAAEHRSLHLAPRKAAADTTAHPRLPLAAPEDAE